MGVVISDGYTLQQKLAPIRITIPAKLAFEEDGFISVLRQTSRLFGCDPCVSGRNCLFSHERMMVNEKIGIRKVAFPESKNAEIEDRNLAIGSWPTPEVTLVLPMEVSTNFESLTSAFRNLLKTLGCIHCHSGWDITLAHERTLYADSKGNILPQQFKM